MIKIKCLNTDGCYIVRNQQKKVRVQFTDGYCSPCGMEQPTECTSDMSKRNWKKFCDKYGLEEVIYPTPLFKIVGCRKREVAEQFYFNVIDFPDKYFTMKTRSGEYLLVVCLRDLELQWYTSKEIWLGYYNGFDYIAKREDLPEDFTFYFDEDKYTTIVWRVERKPHTNKKLI